MSAPSSLTVESIEWRVFDATDGFVVDEGNERNMRDLFEIECAEHPHRQLEMHSRPVGAWEVVK